MSATGFPISQLITAIRQASLPAVINALDAGADIEEADQHGQAGLPLRTSCFAGNVEVVRELIVRGANVNAAGSDGPGMPLRLALRARNMEIVALLLACGAQVPPGVTLPPELQADRQKTPTRQQEMPAIEFTPPPRPVSPPAELFPELPLATTTLPAPAQGIENYHVLEEVDITANYGLDTNLLTLDMLRQNEEAAKAAAQKTQQPTSANAPQDKKPGFWKSRQNP
jgi:hypothetical protein